VAVSSSSCSRLRGKVIAFTWFSVSDATPK
jgi:hypothetical protein